MKKYIMNKKCVTLRCNLAHNTFIFAERKFICNLKY